MKKSNRKEYIHNYDKQYSAQIKRLERSSTSDINKRLICEFEKQCFIKEKIVLPTRVKYLDVLTTIAQKYVKKNFDKLTREDFEDIVCAIEEVDSITISTKQKYRALLKKFGRWLKYRDKMFIPNGIKKYPKTVEWIDTSIKAKDKPRIKASEILTEEEVEKLINAAEHPRDKAFISMLYELGARIGEIGILKINDISRDEYSYIIDLSGKTGHRTPRIIFSDPYLSNWLNQHPFRNENGALWVAKDNRSKRFVNRRLDHRSLLKIVKKLSRKAGIQKRVYPHLFRHSRVTHLLKNRLINEAQAKVFFGWVPNSTVLSEYSHLVSADVNDTLLEINGIKSGKEKEAGMRAKMCESCKKINANGAFFCQYCSKPLDFDTVVRIDEMNRKAMDKLSSLKLEDLQKVLEIAKRLS